MSEPVRRWGTAGRPGEPAAQGRVPLDLIMTAAAVGTFDWDVRADHLVWDEQICNLFGIDPATFDGRIATFWSALVDDDGAARWMGFSTSGATATSPSTPRRRRRSRPISRRRARRRHVWPSACAPCRISCAMKV